MKKLVLDTRVFRRLVEAETRSDVQGLLSSINALRPIHITSTFALWPEYVGLSRPPFRSPQGNSPLAVIKTLREFNSAVTETFDLLFNSYYSDACLKPSHLKEMADTFLHRRLSTSIGDAREIAQSVVYFDGQDFDGHSFSWSALSNQLAIEYAVDELFYLVRFLPASVFGAIMLFIQQIRDTLSHYHHLPMFRLIDSVISYLLKVHTELPDETSRGFRRAIRESLRGKRPLTERELGDCAFLWNAVQGIFGDLGLEHTTVITCDSESPKRLRLLIDVLTVEIEGIRPPAHIADAA